MASKAGKTYTPGRNHELLLLFLSGVDNLSRQISINTKTGLKKKKEGTYDSSTAAQQLEARTLKLNVRDAAHVHHVLLGLAAASGGLDALVADGEEVLRAAAPAEEAVGPGCAVPDDLP